MNTIMTGIENSSQASQYKAQLAKNKAVAEILLEIKNSETILEASTASYRVSKRLDRIGHKFGFYTLRDIVGMAENSQGIKNVFIEKYEAHVAAQKVKITSMLKPFQTEKVNYKDLQHSGSMALVGKMGEGKNAICMEPWFEIAKLNGQMPVFVAPLRSLLAKFIGSYEHYKTLEDPMSPRAGLRTTAHSFVLDINDDIRNKTECLFIDEFVKTTEVIASKIWGKDDLESRINAWSEIISVVKKCDKVVLSDAHLGQAHIDIIERLSGKKFPAYEPLESTYSNIEIKYGYSPEFLIEESLRILSKNSNICVTTTKKAKVAHFFDGSIDGGRALESLYKSKNVRAIFLHSAEKNNVGGKVYEASIDPSALEDFDVVICSPAIGPGWSCVLPQFTEVMIECAGTISPASVMQCIKRFRAVKNVNIAFNLNGKGCSARRNLPETASNVAFYEASEEFIDDAVDHEAALKRSMKILNSSVGNAVCEMKAMDNWSRNNYESFVVRGLEILGFNVKYDSDKVYSDIAEDKKISAKEILAIKKAFYANDQLLDAKGIQAAIRDKERNGADQQAQFLIEKSMDAQSMGISKFKEVDIEFALELGGISALKRCDLMLGNGKITLSNTVKTGLFREISQFGGNSDVVGSVEVEAFVESLRTEKMRWNGKPISKFTLLTKTLFEVRGAAKPLSAAKGILALLGIKLKSSPCRTAGKYVIDKSLHGRAISYLNNIESTHVSRADAA